MHSLLELGPYCPRDLFCQVQATNASQALLNNRSKAEDLCVCIICLSLGLSPRDLFCQVQATPPSQELLENRSTAEDCCPSFVERQTGRLHKSGEFICMFCLSSGQCLYVRRP